MVWRNVSKNWEFKNLQKKLFRKNWKEVKFSKVALFQSPLFKIPSFMFDLRVITAKCVMLRCKVWRTNLFTVVDLFTTPNFIALWRRLKRLFSIEFERGGNWKRASKVNWISHLHFSNSIKIKPKSNCQVLSTVHCDWEIQTKFRKKWGSFSFSPTPHTTTNFMV